MAHQQERFASFLRKEIAGFLQQNTPHNEDAFISVTRVITKERSDKADVLISIFPDKNADAIFHNIKRMEKSARKYIASRSRRHFIPLIKFVLYGGDKSANLENLLEKVKNE
ncbi:MAG: hypothetical protein UV75_C0002G0092 [Candidatus Giovannonibacteria bacterium GW2011_GWA1_43_15]|nr:MAG: hypothetical protein UV72_C0001G0086 [Candidatus Giovannonibacteria bacterium GW2011_GWB1_43_13]KKS99711.1 MAG: hypothetical protein UV75_C0002G0092 [Candidatus Giovannonibacteria bacterium GW2011_GWA1_43_15]KKT21879.1 MAG: hypothetical protein UW05_C0001G0026 [Candidatus Giovannonibacteria bacterium GW2011_GWC2_43_8]KKT63796.1 MAG: hypothetical protein UW55_C0001G0089 [Candidatus Giovannonibacteria bacterium GW2011_GWA2_44_26]